MRTREWESIQRKASVEAFGRWLETLANHDNWSRGDVCTCPLHDFIEWATGHSLAINSPELSEHWNDRESQTWPTPWWMTWLIRSIDQSGSGRIERDELTLIFRIGQARDWHTPVMSEKELKDAARAYKKEQP